MYTKYTFDTEEVVTYPTWAEFRKIPLCQIYGSHTMHSFDTIFALLDGKVVLQVEDFLNKIFDSPLMLASPDAGGNFTRSVSVTNQNPIDVRRALRLFRDENDWSNTLVFVDKITFCLQPITRQLTRIEFNIMFMNRNLKVINGFLDRLQRIQLIDEFLLEE